MKYRVFIAAVTAVITGTVTMFLLRNFTRVGLFEVIAGTYQASVTGWMAVMIQTEKDKVKILKDHNPEGVKK